MRKKPRGQSIIEYVVIITLVAFGIGVFGPYTIRGINAHLKSWEDSVEDSVTDPLIIEKTDILPPTCECVVESVACGGSPCLTNEMLLQKNCSPLNCQPALNCNVKANCCQIDDRCCTPWTQMANCGQGGCGPNEKQMTRQCGAKPAETSCQFDPACGGMCQGATIPNTDICHGADSPPPPIPPGTNWTLVSACSGGKCEVVCKPGFTYHGGICLPPQCGNGDCDPSEGPCSCPGDCGQPPSIASCRFLSTENDTCSSNVICPCGSGGYCECAVEEYEMLRVCTGDCTKDEAKITVCCPKAKNQMSCVAKSSEGGSGHLPPAGCSGAQPYQLAFYCETQDRRDGGKPCDNDDAYVRICCSTRQSCRAISVSTAEGFATCSANEYSVWQYCTGNCDGDDAKTTVCCLSDDPLICAQAL